MAFLTMTATVTVNPAFLQEIKEGNHELWQSLADLRHRCSCPITTGMCRHLVNSLSELRDQLTLHFALEEAYGYFDEPLHVEPQLSEKAGRLRSEHQELYSELSDLVDQAERMPCYLVRERHDPGEHGRGVTGPRPLAGWQPDI